jgi:hypothetical protein
LSTLKTENLKEAIESVAEGRIEGEVASIDGPVFNATVAFGAISSVTDAKGRFLLEHVPAGIGRITVKSPSPKLRDSDQGVLVEAGERKKGVFVFLRQVGGKLEGKVVDEKDVPLSAEVWGFFKPGQPPEIARTDEKGQYSFSEVLPGSYYVRATAQGHGIEDNSVTIVGGQSNKANFVLKSG